MIRSGITHKESPGGFVQVPRNATGHLTGWKELSHQKDPFRKNSLNSFSSKHPRFTLPYMISTNAKNSCSRIIAAVTIRTGVGKVPQPLLSHTPTHRYAMDPACGLYSVPVGDFLRLHSVPSCRTGNTGANPGGCCPGPRHDRNAAPSYGSECLCREDS